MGKKKTQAHDKHSPFHMFPSGVDSGLDCCFLSFESLALV